MHVFTYLLFSLARLYGKIYGYDSCGPCLVCTPWLIAIHFLVWVNLMQSVRQYIFIVPQIVFVLDLMICKMLWKGLGKHSCQQGGIVIQLVNRAVWPHNTCDIVPIKPKQWSASHFSSCQCIITDACHEISANDHNRRIVLMFKQVLSISTQWNVWRPVRRICMMMLEP